MELLEFMYKYYDKKFEIYLKHVTPEGVPWYEEVIFYGEIDDWCAFCGAQRQLVR